MMSILHKAPVCAGVGCTWGCMHRLPYHQNPVVLSGRYIVFCFEVNRFDAEITVVVSYLKIAFHMGIVLTANMKYLLSNSVFPM